MRPELFDRLYTDWSTLVRFQRTRGVLRLMAAVIHRLCDKRDKNPLIIPSMIPIENPRLQFELTRYLSNYWEPIIEHDANRPQLLPGRLDAKISALAKPHVAQRVVRMLIQICVPETVKTHRKCVSCWPHLCESTFPFCPQEVRW